MGREIPRPTIRLHLDDATDASAAVGVDADESDTEQATCGFERRPDQGRPVERAQAAAASPDPWKNSLIASGMNGPRMANAAGMSASRKTAAVAEGSYHS
jgi:hypothetical protein